MNVASIAPTTRSHVATAHPAAPAASQRLWRRCLMMGLNTQLAYANAHLLFTTPDGYTTGVLQILPSLTQPNPDLRAAHQLLGAIAPCGPFAYLPAPSRPWPQQPPAAVLELVTQLPEPWCIYLSNATPQTHVCVRAACWQTLVQAGDTDQAANIYASLAGLLLGAVLFARLLI